jgi:predicted benzoate:H+ symporter BenE
MANNSSIPTQCTLQQAICLDCRRRRGAIVRVLHGAVAGGVGVAFIGYVAGVGGQQVQQLQEGQDDHQRFQSFL